MGAANIISAPRSPMPSQTINRCSNTAITPVSPRVIARESIGCKLGTSSRRYFNTGMENSASRSVSTQREVTVLTLV